MTSPSAAKGRSPPAPIAHRRKASCFRRRSTSAGRFARGSSRSGVDIQRRRLHARSDDTRRVMTSPSAAKGRSPPAPIAHRRKASCFRRRSTSAGRFARGSSRSGARRRDASGVKRVGPLRGIHSAASTPRHPLRVIHSASSTPRHPLRVTHSASSRSSRRTVAPQQRERQTFLPAVSRGVSCAAAIGSVPLPLWRCLSCVATHCLGPSSWRELRPFS